MRPALKRFIDDYFGDSPPPEALAALHAAILADRQATIGYLIRMLADEGWVRMDHSGYERAMKEHMGDAWELPTGLEDLL